MKCDGDRLVEYAVGVLNEAQSEAIEAHVRICPSCTQRLTELRETVALLESGISRFCRRF